MMDRGQECCSTSHSAKGSLPKAKNNLTQNVNSAEVAKPFAMGKVTELGYSKVGKDWKMKILEDKITNKMVLKFQKEQCEQLVLCYLPISK